MLSWGTIPFQADVTHQIQVGLLEQVAFQAQVAPQAKISIWTHHWICELSPGATTASVDHCLRPPFHWWIALLGNHCICLLTINAFVDCSTGPPLHLWMALQGPHCICGLSLGIIHKLHCRIALQDHPTGLPFKIAFQDSPHLPKDCPSGLPSRVPFQYCPSGSPSRFPS